MRPIIVLALLILAVLLGIFIYNVTAPEHDSLDGKYAYNGQNLIIQWGSAKYGDIPVTITEVREKNVFDLYASSNTFPSGRYVYSNGNLIGMNNGVTFLKR